MKRQNFEYAVLGADCSKALWLRYIEFEVRLEELRKLRAKRLGVKNNDAQMAPSIRRLHSLFQRATRKYRGDLELWMQWVEFSKQVGSNNVLSRSIGKALLLHPLVPALWILAADWEYSHNANIVAARELMLRGLRGNDTSLEMWMEYFRLELVYLNKVLRRLNLLAQKKAAPLADDDVLALPEDETNKVDDDAADEPKVDVPDDVAQRVPDSAFAKGAVPLAVFSSALQHRTLLKDQVERAWQFLRLARKLDAPTELLSQMETLLHSNYAASLRFWKLRASDLLDGQPERPPAADAEVEALLQQAVQHLAREQHWELTIAALSKWPDRVVERCAAAEAAGQATPFVWCAHISALMSQGRLTEAIRSGERAVEMWPADVQCWMHNLTASLALLQQQPPSNAAVHTLRHRFKQCLKQVGTGPETFDLRALFLQLLFALPAHEVSTDRVLSVVAPFTAHEQLSQLAELALQCAFQCWYSALVTSYAYSFAQRISTILRLLHSHCA